jgi:hypothetical protein
MQWKVFSACAAGKHHLDEGAPCQDAAHHDVRGARFIGVVCDGAGSAREAHRGAQFFARCVAELLEEAAERGRLSLVLAPDPAEGPPAAEDALGIVGIVDIVALARTKLGEFALEHDLALRDLACTMVGCIATHEGGCFFHVGDGYGICVTGTGMETDAGKGTSKTVLSRPENGEYGDQTYFVTDDQWRDHLRVTAIPELGRDALIGLMSDGTSPFAVNRERSGFFPPFIDPVLAFLRQAGEAEGKLALQGVLESERTLAITTDDKTLLLALAG